MRPMLRVLRYEETDDVPTSGTVNETLSYHTIMNKLKERLQENVLFNQIKILSISAKRYQLDPDVLNTADAKMSTYVKAYNPDARGRKARDNTDNLLNLPAAKRGIWKPGQALTAFIKPHWSAEYNLEGNTSMASAPVAFTKRFPWWSLDEMESLTMADCTNGVHIQISTSSARTIKTFYTVRYMLRQIDNALLYV